jgi:hypothetical protein
MRPRFRLGSRVAARLIPYHCLQFEPGLGKRAGDSLLGGTRQLLQPPQLRVTDEPGGDYSAAATSEASVWVGARLGI